MSAATAVRPDATLRGAAETAREAALAVAGGDVVGDHLGMEMVEDRLATHYFASTSSAYPGWRWAVSVARVPRSKSVTVCEVDLVPGEGALLSPAWLPYAARLAPGDLGPGDVTPYVEADPLLEPGFEATGDEDVDTVAFWELGLGRPRVLSAEGRDAAAQRWYDGDNGPTAPVAEKAPMACSSCGFFLPMPGALRAVFGVCANEWSPSDGKVVSLDHGCGAHSEVEAPAPAAERVSSPILDDFELDPA